MKTSTVRVRNKKKNKIFTMDAVDYARGKKFTSDNYELVSGEVHDDSNIEVKAKSGSGSEPAVVEPSISEIETLTTSQPDLSIEEAVNESAPEGLEVEVELQEPSEQPKRGRGRPRKNG